MESQKKSVEESVGELFSKKIPKQENPFSVNIQTVKNGWVNVLNPFRGTLVLGQTGSGKSESIIKSYINQLLEKGFTMAIYDYKSPELTQVAYQFYLDSQQKGSPSVDPKPAFYAINFADPRYSARCNPFLMDSFDYQHAQQAAQAILFSLSSTWRHKPYSFFVEASVSYLTGCIMYLKIKTDNQIASEGETINYCSLPHLIEFATKPYQEIIPLLHSLKETALMASIFANYLEQDAIAQLESILTPVYTYLSRLKNSTIYWIMSGDKSLMDINNPAEPKIVCLRNQEAEQYLFAAPLSLLSQLMVSQINQSGKRQSALIFDDLDTIYFNNLDTLLATARSNKIAACIAAEDLTQLEWNYGESFAKRIFNESGTLFAGQVHPKTAERVAERINKLIVENWPADKPLFFWQEQKDAIPTIPISIFNNMPSGCFAGNVTPTSLPGQLSKGNQSLFLDRIALGEQIAYDPNRPLPANPELEGLSDSELEQRLADNVILIEKQVTALVQQAR